MQAITATLLKPRTGDSIMTEQNHAQENAASWLESISEMLAAMDAAQEVEGHEAQDEAERAIYETPLSVRVRDDWRDIGEEFNADHCQPAEYEILLTTGGPALRITGAVSNHGEPDDFPRLEWQDWGTPWTEYEPARKDRVMLQRFATFFIQPF